jgi:CBS domain-containing protein
MCTRSDTLKSVLYTLAKHNIHRLIVVDDLQKKHLVGIITVNDILKLFIQGKVDT